VNAWKSPVQYLFQVLAAEECDALIQLAETLGFESARIDGPAEGPHGFRAEDGRDNARAAIEDVSIAALLWERLAQRIEPAEGVRALGINERLRFYRYDPGQSFPPHTDGFFERDGARSRQTLLVYLNEDFDGGETCFPSTQTLCQPVRGGALIFPHTLLHDGRAVTRGRKYVLRTDVMYAAE
jgi:prolyl 4-hydroxylase